MNQDPTGGGVVRAERVELRQAGAGKIEATSVSVIQGGASRIHASDVSIMQGGAGIVRADSLRLESGAAVMAVATGRAEIRPGARVMVLVARETTGDVQPILDWRGALALVAGFLVVREVLGLLRAR